MFQTFDDTTSPATSAPRLAALRQAMAAQGLDAFVVPKTDEHQGAALPPGSERLRWLTSYTGSFGLAVVTADRAALLVDGRYTLQARAQTDAAKVEVIFTMDTSAEAWAQTALKRGAVIGLDPWLHTADQVRKWRAVAAKLGGSVKLVEANPVDVAWIDRPPAPKGKVIVQGREYSGSSPREKLDRVAAALKEIGADHIAVTQPDIIAWTLDIRGADVSNTPVALAFAIFSADGGAELFIDPAKLDDAVRAHLANVASIAPREGFAKRLTALGAAKAAVLVDPQASPHAVGHLVESAGGRIVAETDPIVMLRAPKNAVELAGARAAHKRDGAAMARFLHWFDREAPKGKLTEIDVVTALEGFRREGGALMDVSFPSISGAGPNGAIVHYRVTTGTNRKVDQDSLFLIDSGGQYRDGTTDVTRTLAVGNPTREMKARFTDVLKGMIAVSLARFPLGTSGVQLDILARQALWAQGFDYDHGTGHGVGSYLGVHEGPCRIAKLPSPAIKPGMILSNEPGYYKEGAFGIRIECLVIVTEPQAIPGGDRPMMGFETLTLVPIDRRLIVKSRLTRVERAWVDAYHARVLTEIGPALDGADLAWLRAACAPL